MERVAHLVRLHTDEARLNAVVHLVEVVRGRLLGEREALVEERRRILPERSRLQHHPLPKQALRFVHPHAERRRHGESLRLVRRVATLLIERVARLVDRRTKALDPVVGEARRQAHVGRARTAGERVRRDVETAVMEAIAQRGCHLARQRGLLFRRPLRAGLERRV
eukprot:5718536-Prymnesium_polylepis.1